MIDQWLGAPTLEYGSVRLRPLEMADAEALGSLVDDPALFKWAPGVPTDIASAQDFISTALDARAAGTRTAFVVLDGDRIVGSTSYYEIDRANMATAIGYTFYTDSVQGTVVNPTCKYLLLRHAFEKCGAVRVVWHTHEDNAQSRAAIAKLGAQFEGLLRKHRRFGDGWRTTAQYAVTDDDWPTVKERLLERIG